MEDFWRLIIQEEYSAVRQPVIEANNFELKSALITMVQLLRLFRVLKLFPRVGTCNASKYTLVIFDMFRVFCKHNLNVL